jgi:hypothetical protein
MLNRVLFIAYAFPPVGGAGVQRTTKFIKYLPHFGWLPSVLTVANPSVPLFDKSLTADIPEQTIVRRAPTWEPGYALKSAVASGGGDRGAGLGGRAKRLVRRLGSFVLQPDPQVLWLPGAIREGSRLLREIRHDVVMVSGPPFSTFLVGTALARRARLPLVLDYRDEWVLRTAYEENQSLDPLSRGIQGMLQRRVVRAASALVGTTRRSAEALKQVRRSAGSKAAVTWIYNGFDAEDFPSPLPAGDPGNDPYRLAYVGTLWNLTSVRPLVEGVRRFAACQPDLARHLELLFIGRRTPEQQKFLDGLEGLPCRVVHQPYVDHSAAIDLLCRAGGLSVLLSDVPGAERVVPAKVFEYLAARRPILGIAPRGELWDVLGDCPGARLLEPTDIDGIASYLAEETRRHREGRGLDLRNWDVSQYDRRNQAFRLAQLLDDLAGKQCRPRELEFLGPASGKGARNHAHAARL